MAPKTAVKNLRNSATLAALFGEDGVFGERPRALTLPIPTTPPAYATPPNLIVTLSNNANTSFKSDQTSPPSRSSTTASANELTSSQHSTFEEMPSMASLGSYEVCFYMINILLKRYTNPLFSKR